MSGRLSSAETLPESADNRRDWVEFVQLSLGDDSYKLELGRVKQIRRNPPMTQVPQTGPAIAGVTNLGGEIAVVVDGRAMFEVPPRPEGADTVLLLFDRPNGRPTGLLVDDVPGIDPHHIDHVDAPSDSDDWQPGVGEQWFRAVIDEPDETAHPIGVLDLDVVVAEARVQS